MEYLRRPVKADGDQFDFVRNEDIFIEQRGSQAHILGSASKIIRSAEVWLKWRG